MLNEFGHEEPEWKAHSEALRKRVERSQREAAQEKSEREQEARARGITVDELIRERRREYERQLVQEARDRKDADPWIAQTREVEVADSWLQEAEARGLSLSELMAERQLEAEALQSRDLENP